MLIWELALHLQMSTVGQEDKCKRCSKICSNCKHCLLEKVSNKTIFIVTHPVIFLQRMLVKGIRSPAQQLTEQHFPTTLTSHPFPERTSSKNLLTMRKTGRKNKNFYLWDQIHQKERQVYPIEYRVSVNMIYRV